MQEKIPTPESLPADKKTTEEEDKFKKQVKKIMDDIKSIEEGTGIALSKLEGDKRKIGVEPDNRVEERRD